MNFAARQGCRQPRHRMHAARCGRTAVAGAEAAESRARAAFNPFDDDITWQRFAQLGYNALRGQVEPSASTVILNHHQHFDGSGFPLPEGAENMPNGSDIHVFARIATAADTFQHLLQLRTACRSRRSWQRWNVQNSAIRSWFDPDCDGGRCSRSPNRSFRG